MIPEQNTPEWEEMRKTMIGASDVPIILGLSPWNTPYGLWLQKTGRKENTVTSAMAYGTEKEDEIRREFSLSMEDEFMPKVMFHKEHNFLMASLDGINFNGDVILEVKTCNHEVFNMAQSNNIPPHYYAQIQAQLFCTPTAEFAFYLCYHKGKTAYFKVRPDKKFQRDMVEALYDFYDMMIHDVPPPLMEKDSILIEDDPEFEAAAKKWLDAKDMLKVAQDMEKRCREELIALTDDGNCEGYGVSLRRSFRATVDYKKACTENDIDLDQYRKPSIGFWTIKEVKDERIDI